MIFNWNLLDHLTADKGFDFEVAYCEIENIN